MSAYCYYQNCNTYCCDVNGYCPSSTGRSCYYYYANYNSYYNSYSSTSSSSSTAIIGGIIGGLVGFLLLIFLISWFATKRYNVVSIGADDPIPPHLLYGRGGQQVMVTQPSAPQPMMQMVVMQPNQAAMQMAQNTAAQPMFDNQPQLDNTLGVVKNPYGN